MECCRICLATNELSNIFETEEIALNITAIAYVQISQNDGLPQYICILCRHELDISINFKDKCETTFNMLKEQHYSKEIEVKENIILNLLSGGNALDNKLPQRTRESILNTVKNSVQNNVKSRIVGDYAEDKECSLDKEKLILRKDEVVYEENSFQQEKVFEEHQTQQTKVSIQQETESIREFDDQMSFMIDSDDQMTTVTDADDQMTDITENEFEIPESLNITNQDLMCLKCNFCFVNERSLFDHLKRIHEKTMGQCQICLLYFPTSQLLRDHLSLKHDISEANEILINRCKICNKSFELQSELNLHLCLPGNENDFRCDLCQLNFKLEVDLDNHIKNIHPQVEFTCEECKEKFVVFEHYRRHLKEHSEIDRNINRIELLCLECNKLFLSKEEWNKHIDCDHTKDNLKEKETKNLKRHTGNLKKNLACPLCEECFKTTSRYEVHVRSHIREKLQKCKLCHKSFAKPSHLAAHQRTHNGIKPHICSICQMSFYKKNNLEKHLLQHDNLIKCTREETYKVVSFDEFV